MMMKNKKNVPDIRFSEFGGNWASRRFDKTFSTLSNNTLSRADLNYETGSTKNVHYGDILIKFGECTDVSYEDIPYISDEKIAAKYFAARLQDGDIVFADTAEDATAGKCTEFFNIKGQPIISGLHTIPCHPLLSFSTGYLGYFLNSPAYHNQLLSLMQGTKVVGISKSAIKETNVSFPKNTDEQKAIGSYFQNVDRLINASQTKLDKLKNIKKACLEKMFLRNGSTTPKLRFKGFTEEWEHLYLKDTGIWDKGRGLLKAELENEGKYPCIHYGELFAYTEIIKEVVSTTNVQGNSVSSGNDLLFPDSDVTPDGLGRCSSIEAQNVILGGGINILKLYDCFQAPYMSLNVNNNKKQIIERVTGTTVRHIHSKELSCIELFVSKDSTEQTQIGNFFKNIDDLIAKTEQQINKLRNIKKACLDKMFVNE